MTNIELLEEVLRRKLQNKNELLSFCIRPGIVFKDIEIFCNGHMTAISQKHLDNAVKTDNLENFADGVLESVRSVMFRKKPNYLPKDLVKECIYEFETLLKRLFSDNFEAIHKKARERISELAEHTRLSEPAYDRAYLNILKKFVEKKIRSRNE